MGLFSAFSKQRPPRGFNLQHRYYDEKKARQAVLKAQREGTESISSEARREQLRETWARKRMTASTGKSKRNPLVWILVAIIMAYLLFKVIPAGLTLYLGASS
ncbi:MAG: hypothetical protein HQ473_04705 [Cryomorphaceae bacterium]|nr:hypothetical protein [Cryomorphaceae bacterium]|tara:strand:+ start:630 stop:938 length:309 start_codon:yes stop_codon:yes gene_type:complete